MPAIHLNVRGFCLYYLFAVKRQLINFTVVTPYVK